MEKVLELQIGACQIAGGGGGSVQMHVCVRKELAPKGQPLALLAPLCRMLAMLTCAKDPALIGPPLRPL